MKKSCLLFILTILIIGCSGSDDSPSENELIDPTDSNALSRVLIMPDGTRSNQGTPPSPSATNEAPLVLNQVSSINSSNGSTSPLAFSYSNVNGNLGGCYVQVDGAGNYFTVPYNSNSASSGNLQLPLGIPTNVDEGTFCVNFCVYDTNGFVSNIVYTCVNVLRLGTGALQISLSWNNNTDQDLYVTDPGGEIISFTNTRSSSGGILDRDDIDGYGPENIFWLEDAPDGTYNVKVNDFEDTNTPNIFYITINGSGQSRNFEGTTQGGSTADVVTFTKNGDNLTFIE
ncbi:YfaP family protein [Flavivirga rizhaonensis]|uniref:Uncharacterized protein n=1 Tax=Flavivirga rizhaonensis TaxID=2559571 RepID=A0A4S1DVB3_9FLAO|nr:hypothetical protein [Flavivirga rizhaonensis]TGV01795.1 hypothetical protein EM932_14065 [Flavivirga rizhaonensis]